MKTFSAKPLEVKREWYVVDATDKVVGRLAAEIALRLRGKDKPEYTPHVDTGDYIIVVNADKLVMTGAKAEDKKYFRHSGYPGGLHETKYRLLMQDKPELAMKLAIRGMMPRNIITKDSLSRLKIYRGAEHVHAAQKPESWTQE